MPTFPVLLYFGWMVGRYIYGDVSLMLLCFLYCVISVFIFVLGLSRSWQLLNPRLRFRMAMTSESRSICVV